MKAFLLLLLGAVIHSTDAVTHSLQYFYTGSTGMEQFPQFVAVGIVDGQQIDYYDSVSEENVLKQTWMKGVRDEKRITDIRRGHQQSYKANVGVLMQRFNQTAGIHVFQFMYGCEWDEETKAKKGFLQYGYDGEDFIAFDLSSKKWTAPTPQAVITKNKWDNDRGWITQADTYLNQECPDWINTYMNYGKTSLMRTEKPSVSFLQKSSSSPVRCHATGFYPNKAELFWRKGGEEIHEGVDKGEILPNNDGSFQMSVDLDLSSVPTGDWNKYECVFQLSGVNEDIVTKLEKILTNERDWTIIIIIAAVIVVAVAVIVVGIIFREKISEKLCSKRPPTPIDNREVEEEMIPKGNKT